MATTYLSPGVYIEEVEAGSRPIEGVGTAVAAFVGLAARGPVNTPTLVTNWSQFTQTFGDFIEGSYLAHAVYGYFLNGGGARLRRPHRRRTARADRAGRAAQRLRTTALAAYRDRPRSSRPRPATTSPSRSRPAPSAPRTPSSSSSTAGGTVVETFDNVTTKQGQAERRHGGQERSRS